MIKGYARVSTDGQSLDAQVKRLRAAGAEEVWRETISGAKSDRVQLDRLARSTRDLLNTLAAITGKRAGFRSLGDAWADTTTAHGRLMLTVLGGLAEFERDLIRARTSEGRARAVANGVKLGRKPYPSPAARGHQARPGGIARSYDVSRWTISRLPLVDTENRGPGAGPMMPPGARTRRSGAFYDLMAVPTPAIAQNAPAASLRGFSLYVALGQHVCGVDGHPRHRGARS